MVLLTSLLPTMSAPISTTSTTWWQGVVTGYPRGEFWFEVSYLKSVLEGTLFDTIYHEHLDYHHLLPLLPFSPARAGSGTRRKLRLMVALSEYALRDRVFGKRRRGSVLFWKRSGSGMDCLRHGGPADADRPTGQRVNTQLDRFAAEGLRGGGYGAPAKATTLMHQFGIDGTRWFYRG